MSPNNLSTLFTIGAVLTLALILLMRIEPRFGKLVPDDFRAQLVLVAMFGSFAADDRRLLVRVIVCSLVACMTIALAGLAVVIVAGIMGVLVHHVDRLVDHLRHWLRWLTTAYLRAGGPGRPLLSVRSFAAVRGGAARPSLVWGHTNA